MKSIKPDNSISAQLSTIRLKDSIADFSKFEIKIYQWYNIDNENNSKVNKIDATIIAYTFTLLLDNPR